MVALVTKLTTLVAGGAFDHWPIPHRVPNELTKGALMRRERADRRGRLGLSSSEADLSP